MKLLLDTHAFIWWNDNHSQLSPKVLAACTDPNNTLVLSVAGIWELQIKIQAGKLKFSLPLPDIIQPHLTNGLAILPIIPPHVFALDQLPDHHRDPFDRLMIAQAIYEKMTLVSSDSNVVKYPVPILW